MPLSRGGRNIGSNKVMCCRACNGVKGDMLPDEWESFMKDNPKWWTLSGADVRRIRIHNSMIERREKVRHGRC